MSVPEDIDAFLERIADDYGGFLPRARSVAPREGYVRDLRLGGYAESDETYRASLTAALDEWDGPEASS